MYQVIGADKFEYGPIDAAPPAVDTTPQPPSARPSRLRRWFVREEQA